MGAVIRPLGWPESVGVDGVAQSIEDGMIEHGTDTDSTQRAFKHDVFCTLVQLDDVGVEHDFDADDDAARKMLWRRVKRKSLDCSAIGHAGGGGGYGDGLQADHLAHDAAGGVGGGDEDGVEAEAGRR